MALRELDILARLRALLPGGNALSDDCGAIPMPPAGEVLLVTTDLMEEGVHFKKEWHPPEMLGRKVLAVNLSDLDGSGARPIGFTFTLALPPDLDMAWIESLLAGLATAAREAGVPVIGGDTTGSSSGIGLGITAFGTAKRWLRRDGIQPGDHVYVDQPLGRSTRGLRKLQAGARWDPTRPDAELACHLDPRPSLGLGPRLAGIPEVHACMDISDGLSRDLRMFADASGVTLQLAPGLDADELSGGEDYARCFASSLGKVELEARLGQPSFEVARAVDRAAEPLLVYDGNSWKSMDDRSFDHFANRTDCS